MTEPSSSGAPRRTAASMMARFRQMGAGTSSTSNNDGGSSAGGQFAALSQADPDVNVPDYTTTASRSIASSTGHPSSPESGPIDGNTPELSSSRTTTITTEEEVDALLTPDADATTTSGLSHPVREEAEEEEDGFLDPHAPAGMTTVWQSFVHLVKGYIGPGCLSLPWSFSQLGIPLGLLCVVVLGVWSTHNCWTVVECKRLINDGAGGRRPRPLTYPQVVAHYYGPRFGRLTQVAVSLQQLSICTVFLSFVGANLQAVLEVLWQDGGLSHIQVVTICLPAVVALALIPNIRSLTPVTVAATLLLFFALGCWFVVVCLAWISDDYVIDNADLWTLPASFGRVPLALCALLYSYEGICLILPIETSCAQPEYFGKTLSASMSCVAVTFATVGAVSVATFGHVTNGSITAYLLETYQHTQPTWLPYLWTANAAVSVSVLLTYPLQMLPAIQLLEQQQHLHSSDQHSTLQHQPLSTQDDEEGADDGFLQNDTNPFRKAVPKPTTGDEEVGEEDPNINRPLPETTTPSPSSTFSWTLRVRVVLCTYLVAVGVPNVQALISLAGALCGSTTALLIPPFLQLVRLRRQSQQEGAPQPSIASWVLSYILVIMGFAFLIVGTSASLLDIVEVYRHADGGEASGSFDEQSEGILASKLPGHG